MNFVPFADLVKYLVVQGVDVNPARVAGRVVDGLVVDDAKLEVVGLTADTEAKQAHLNDRNQELKEQESKETRARY